MRSFLKIFFLSYITVHASAAVLPRSHQPCPHHEPAGQLIDEYIVELHPYHNLDDHFRNIGMDLTREGTDFFSRMDALHSYRARLTEEFVHNVIRYDPGVHSVERGAIIGPEAFNHTHDLPSRDEPFGISSTLSKRKAKWDRVERKGHYQLQYLAAGEKMTLKDSFAPVEMMQNAGYGVDIYILDSGVRLSHRNFGGRASNFRGKSYSEYTKVDVPMGDRDGHGTHVAGIAGGLIYGVAQWSNIIAVKVGCRDPRDCEGTTPGVTQAINDITVEHEKKKKENPKGWKGSVISMSFVIGADSPRLAKAIDKAFAAGIPIAVGAGNHEEGAKDTKAKGTLCTSKNTICIGGTDKEYKKGWYSNDGKEVNIWAPGDSILSCGKDSDNDGAWKTGTSMSTPAVAGIMATIVSYENLRDNADLVYQRVRANQLPNIISGLKNPWFFGEKENNFFAQTGIKQKTLTKVHNQPYIGPGADWSPTIDPYGPIMRRDNNPNDNNDDGYQNLETTDPGNGEPILIKQEATIPLDNSPAENPPVEPSLTITPDETTAEPAKPTRPAEDSNLCQPNQTQETNCKPGILPDSPPFSGPQQPSCVKADGTPGSRPRLNTKAAHDAAVDYCTTLVDKRWLLKSGLNPAPAVLKGKAEGDKSMVLSVMYYEPSCPQDKSKKELDFGLLTVDKCVEYLAGTLEFACKIDATWGDKYNKDFELQGGVWATDCAMFSLFGQ